MKCCNESKVHSALSVIKILKSCSDLSTGRIIHAGAVESGLISNIFVASALLSMYAKCGNMADARMVFDQMRYHDVVCFNALIFGYVENGEESTALEVFLSVSAPNALTFVAALKACAGIATKQEDLQGRESGKVLNMMVLLWAMALHSRASSYGFDLDIRVESSLIDLYAKSGSLVDAEIIFHRMQHHDVISWNSFLFGNAENGASVRVMELFVSMQSEGFVPNARTFVAVIKAWTNLAAQELEEQQEKLVRGMVIHWHVVRNKCNSDVYVASTLIDMYAKCGSMADAWRTFKTIPHAPVAAWNALLAGYVDNGESSRALNLFFSMEHQNCKPDSRTYGAAVRACGMLGALHIGRELHTEILAKGIDKDDSNAVLVNCLVDFYAKCGSMIEAERMFDSLLTKNMVAWNSLLTGYSRIGHSHRVLELFNKLPDNLRADRVMFSCVLSACSHAGLVNEGKKYFDDMVYKHGIEPDIQHYNCMIDILGRSNQLNAAISLVESMPLKPNVVTWMTILDASRKWKNEELGKLAFDSLLEMECIHGGAFVLMENIYKD